MRRVVLGGAVAIAMAAAVAGCDSEGTVVDAVAGDASSEAGADAAAQPPDAGSGEAAQAPDVGAGTLTSLTVSPLTLQPAFSPDVHDYFVRCAAGANALSVSMTASPGAAAWVIAPVASTIAESQTVPVTVAEDQAIVVSLAGSGAEPYWIRCLPHDFPEITVATHPENGRSTPGYYLTSNTIVAKGEAGFAFILDGNATPVWYRRVPPSAVNLDLQPDGRLSFIQGGGPFGTNPTAQHQLLQLEPWQVSYVAAVGGPTDFHELQQLPNGHYYVQSYQLVSGVDLTGLASYGTNEIIPDCVIQEVDAAGAVVWQWRATDHIDPVKECTEGLATTVDGQPVVDVYHCNSLQAYDDTHVLVSARDLDAVWLIDKSTGKIVWKLGGVPYSKDGAQIISIVGDPETAFYHQHDARLQPNGDISLFDDHTNQAGLARGVEYAIDLASGTAKMVWQYQGPANTVAMGSFRRYPDGSNVISWGLSTTLLLTEVSNDGKALLEMSFDKGNYAYRAVKVPANALDVALLRATVGHP